MKVIDMINNEDGSRDVIAKGDDGLKYKLKNVFMGDFIVENNEVSTEESEWGMISLTMGIRVMCDSKELLDE